MKKVKLVIKRVVLSTAFNSFKRKQRETIPPKNNPDNEIIETNSQNRLLFLFFGIWTMLSSFVVMQVSSISPAALNASAFENACIIKTIIAQSCLLIQAKIIISAYCIELEFERTFFKSFWEAAIIAQMSAEIAAKIIIVFSNASPNIGSSLKNRNNPAAPAPQLCIKPKTVEFAFVHIKLNGNWDVFIKINIAKNMFAIKREFCE